MPAQAALADPEVSKLDEAQTAAVALKEAALEAADADLVAKDPTLADDRAELVSLMAARKANQLAISACQQRIAAKEGVFAIKRARLAEESMTDEQWLAARRGPGGPRGPVR